MRSTRDSVDGGSHAGWLVVPCGCLPLRIGLAYQAVELVIGAGGACSGRAAARMREGYESGFSVFQVTVIRVQVSAVEASLGIGNLAPEPVIVCDERGLALARFRNLVGGIPVGSACNGLNVAGKRRGIPLTSQHIVIGVVRLHSQVVDFPGGQPIFIVVVGCLLPHRVGFLVQQSLGHVLIGGGERIRGTALYYSVSKNLAVCIVGEQFRLGQRVVLVFPANQRLSRQAVACEFYAFGFLHVQISPPLCSLYQQGQMGDVHVGESTVTIGIFGITYEHSVGKRLFAGQVPLGVIICSYLVFPLVCDVIRATVFRIGKVTFGSDRFECRFYRVGLPE